MDSIAALSRAVSFNAQNNLRPGCTVKTDAYSLPTITSILKRKQL